MSGEPFHHGERQLQQRFETVPLADKIVSVTMHDRFTDRDREFIERMDMFFLATSDDDGNLDCSYKGGDPGFVRIVDDTTLVFPWYDGNGMFMSAGNISTHAKVGMLFVDFHNQYRIRVNGIATLDFDDPLIATYPGAQFIAKVTPTQIFGNCPRYIHKMETVQRSVYVPRAEEDTPDAEWKDRFEDVLPPEQQKRRRARKEEPTR